MNISWLNEWISWSFFNGQWIESVRIHSSSYLYNIKSTLALRFVLLLNPTRHIWVKIGLNPILATAENPSNSCKQDNLNFYFKTTNSLDRTFGCDIIISDGKRAGELMDWGNGQVCLWLKTTVFQTSLFLFQWNMNNVSISAAAAGARDTVQRSMPRLLVQ